MDADRVHLIAVELAAEGSAECPPGTDVAAWRRDARAAGRRLSRQVTTVRGPGGTASARLRDWPRDDAELQIHRAALRRAAVAAWTDPGATAEPVAAAGPPIEPLHPSQRTHRPALRLVTDDDLSA